jgi:hypothetical protein
VIKVEEEKLKGKNCHHFLRMLQKGAKVLWTNFSTQKDIFSSSKL